jgi:hypothetical protein
LVGFVRSEETGRKAPAASPTSPFLGARGQDAEPPGFLGAEIGNQALLLFAGNRTILLHSAW